MAAAVMPGLLFPPGQEFFDFTVVVISYLRSVEAQAFQEEYGVLLPGHAVGLFRFNIPKKAGAAVDVAEIHAFYPVEHFFPGFRLQGAELIQSLALVVAVGLAEPLLADGHAVFVHQFIDVVEFQVKPGYGGPVIGGGPVVERVKIIAVNRLVMDFDPCGPGVILETFLGGADNGTEPVQAFVGADADAGGCSAFAGGAEPLGEKEDELFKFHASSEPGPFFWGSCPPLS